VMLSEQSWLLVRRLERAKEAEAELGITRERMRFAGDLHDIQGHTLHVIKLKAALARRLVRVDPDRAEHELDEVRRLIADTIEETRELAYARHELNLASELENARRLCEAIGIDVTVRSSGDPSGPAHVLLAHVLREATTNLLRHAQPTTVSISVTPTRVEVVNDGAPDGSDSDLRGLARLRERVELAGGELWIARTPGRFAVSAVITITATRDKATLLRSARKLES
jgi:two-component system, NarL family, sensor histidine kinase DesK